MYPHGFAHAQKGKVHACFAVLGGGVKFSYGFWIQTSFTGCVGVSL